MTVSPRTSVRTSGWTSGIGSRLAAIVAVAVVSTMLSPTAGGLPLAASHPDVLKGQRGLRHPVIAAAGDIACDPRNSSFHAGRGRGSACRALATEHVLHALGPDAVLPLGDLQYDDGTYTKFLRSYRKSWGRMKSITYPAVGNHEYEASSHAAGYFRYFHGRAGGRGKGYYSYDLGTWHLIALNSECYEVACRRGSDQYRWLQADLAASTAECTLAYWHEPMFSSGPHGGTTAVLPFWRLLYRNGADVILNGHDHIYERFAPQTPTGGRDGATGIREFVVGTGGAQHYWIEHRARNSQRRNVSAFGVLRMSLEPSSYAWRFEPVAGATFSDHGHTDCHGAP